MKKTIFMAFLVVVTAFSTAELSAQEAMKDTITEEAVQVIGTRNKNRVATDTAVPIDILDVSGLTTAAPQTSVNQLLNYAAPSFTSNSTTVADGTDHIDPAQLRGLGPDQVLVLLNGKRRHTSALVNVNGTPGRGTVGTDLNSIPAFAIDRIEVLRDGASSQYGSDAIAGVINVNLKKATGKLNVAMTVGANWTDGANDFDGGMDGEKYQLDLNWGTKLGDQGGFINLTGSGLFRDETSRANPYSGQIFNAYNAIEQRYYERTGNSLSSMFGNITNEATFNATTLLSTIKSNAPFVNYFTAAQQTTISNANTIAAMRTALNFNVTDNELVYRGLERSDFNMRVGQSKLKSGQFYGNMEYPIIPEKVIFYAFGGTSYRNGDAAGFYRRPVQANANTRLYLNGFLPEIHSNIFDFSMAGGIKGKLGEWDYDLSNTYGSNSFKYTIENTTNATLMQNSPDTFDAGKLRFQQNTINLDISRNFDILEGLNIAFGGETRHEVFQETAGELASYAQYDIFGNVVTPGVTPANTFVTDFMNSTAGPGAQVFPGFRPADAKNKDRVSYAGYFDAEVDFTKWFMLNAAIRYEDFSDFGDTFNYKVAIRIKPLENLNIRGAYSTGFRAPSLHQIYFSSTSTLFVPVNGVLVPTENKTFTNDSQAAQAFGIPQLKQEESKNVSFGFTYKIPAAKLSITADAYYIKIDDRIIMTGQFAKPTTATPQNQELVNAFNAAGADRATFFANAVNTESKGIDVVITNNMTFGSVVLKNDLAGTFSETNVVGPLKVSQLLVNNNLRSSYFDDATKTYIESAIPRVKASLGNDLRIKKFNIYIRNTFFGEVTDPNNADLDGSGSIATTTLFGAYPESSYSVASEHATFGAKVITDLSVGYKFSDMITFTIGANNLFDIYPDENPTILNNADQFVYSRNVSQFGFNGRFAFARVNLTF